MAPEEIRPPAITTARWPNLLTITLANGPATIIIIFVIFSYIRSTSGASVCASFVVGRVQLSTPSEPFVGLGSPPSISMYWLKIANRGVPIYCDVSIRRVHQENWDCSREICDHDMRAHIIVSRAPPKIRPDETRLIIRYVHTRVHNDLGRCRYKLRAGSWNLCLCYWHFQK